MRANNLDLNAGPRIQNHMYESEAVIGKNDDDRASQGDGQAIGALWVVHADERSQYRPIV